MRLEDYLYRHYQAYTAKLYLFEIDHYLKWMGKAKAVAANYEMVMTYVHYLRERYDNPKTIYRIVSAIKCYYHYLQASGQRNDHPCRLLNIKDGKRQQMQVQDLLTATELERLLVREERFASYALRNQLVLSLLIYQALLTRELCGLLVGDVDLEKGTIYVRETLKTNGRKLKLEPQQVMLIYRYQTEYRQRFLKEETEVLIISGRGRAERGEGIHYLVTTLRDKVPHKRLTPMTIRQSVIANKLKAGEDLRRVQVFAGHRQPSSTEAYRNTGLEELKAAVAKYHPLK